MSSFEDIIKSHCMRLFRLCVFTISHNSSEIVLSRRFIGKFHLEATWMEETLDAAGARKSEMWFPFREGVSGIKAFTSIVYDVLHVKHSSPHYNLLKIEKDLNSEVDGILNELYKALVKTSKYLVKRAKKCGLHSESVVIDSGEFEDIYEPYPMKRDRKLRHIVNPGKSLIYLATEFLSLKSEMRLFDKLSTLEKRDYKHYIPDSVSEEKLRLVLVRFHNLQSLYDTYLS